MLIPPKLGLYIHFPWCVSKCPYCDFNSHELKSPLEQSSYIQALVNDLTQDLPDVWGRTVHTIFMGGGTPSLFAAESMQTLMTQIRGLLSLKPDAEVTMEVNPGSQEFDHFGGYLDAGINRLSFGVQSLNDAQLKSLKRIHNSQQACQAVRLAKKAGYKNFNLDMMFGLPGQSLEAARLDLEQLCELEPTHISYYQLTIEPNTLFAVKTPDQLPDADLQQDMYLQGQEILQAHGYSQYEVSAYAKAGHQSEHNLNYWRFGDYLGIGAGAHSKITMGHSGEIRRQVKQKHPKSYLNHAASAQRIIESKTVDKDTLIFEFLLNQLRIKEAFRWAHFSATTGLAADELKQKLQPIPTDWLTMDADGVKLTESGFLVSDAILQQVI